MLRASAWNCDRNEERQDSGCLRAASAGRTRPQAHGAAAQALELVGTARMERQTSEQPAQSGTPDRANPGLAGGHQVLSHLQDADSLNR